MLEIVYQWTGWLTSRWGIIVCTVVAIMNAAFGHADVTAAILSVAVLGLVIRCERNQALLKAEIATLQSRFTAAPHLGSSQAPGRG